MEDKIGSVMTKKGMLSSLQMYKNLINNIEKETILKSVNSCEPFMAKYNLYPTIRTNRNKNYAQKIMDFLSYSDGNIFLNDT